MMEHGLAGGVANHGVIVAGQSLLRRSGQGHFYWVRPG
jgi:hypothetical protein